MDEMDVSRSMYVRRLVLVVLLCLFGLVQIGCSESSNNNTPVSEKPDTDTPPADDTPPEPGPVEPDPTVEPDPVPDNSLAPVATVPAVISGAPNADTPMARVLTVSTDMDTRVSVHLTADDHTLEINSKTFSQNHNLPLYGMRAGRTYSARVRVYSQTGKATTAAQSLVVAMETLPAGFPNISVTSDPRTMESGYTLFNVLAQGTANATFGELLVIVDEVGEVVWYHKNPRFLDVRQLANGNIYAQEGSSMVEMDLLGNHITEWATAGLSGYVGPDVTVNTNIFHHEVFPMDNGNFIGLSIEARNFDNFFTSYDDTTARATSFVAGDLIVEYQPDGTIVNQWSMLDMLDPYRIGYGSLGAYWDFFFGAASASKDWSHANAVIHDANDDSVIVSLRHQDALVKFKRQTGELVWILGPPENWDVAKYGQYLLTPVNPQQHFYAYHPHGPMVTPSGSIMVYDNGNWRSSPPDAWEEDANNFSRAVEYVINENTMEVELVWEYGKTSPQVYFSGFLGDADHLPQTGNVLITHGSLISSGKFSAQVVEVTRDTQPVEVFNMTVSDTTADNTSGWRVYRSDRIKSLYGPGVADISAN